MTKDLVRRFKEHKSGRGGRYTQWKKVISMLYSEKQPDRSSATKRELEIKRWNRSKKLILIKSKTTKVVVHKVPVDLRKALVFSPAARTAWEDITPLARNEWICWVESVKKPETRKLHIERTRTELVEGKRRPCCWAGCPHR